MQQNEKDCPRCGETIKAAALVCRYCGHEFTEADVAASKSDAKFRNVDKQLDDLVARAGDFVDNSDCKEIAEDTGKPMSLVRARAKEKGFRIDDGTRYQGSDEARRDSMIGEASRMLLTFTAIELS